jgi:hypothetical protein
MNRAAIIFGLAPSLLCCSSLTVNMVRPAQVDFGKDSAAPSYSFGDWSATDPAWQDVLKRLRDKLKTQIAAGRPGSPVWKESGGAVVLQGVLQSYVIKEEEEQTPTTCTDQNLSVPCTSITVVGSLHLELSMTVRDRNGVVLDTVTAVVNGPEQAGPYVAKDPFIVKSHPVKIDREANLSAALDSIASQLTVVVAPHVEVVSRMIPICDDGKRNCQDGLSALSACEFDKARTSFAAAAATLRTNHDKAADAAAAFWGQALACEFAGDADGALDALKKAAALQPTEAAFTGEGTNVRVEAAYARRVKELGLEQRCVPQAALP